MQDLTGGGPPRLSNITRIVFIPRGVKELHCEDETSTITRVNEAHPKPNVSNVKNPSGALLATIGGIFRVKLTRGQPLASASINAFLVYIVGAGLAYLAQPITARVIGSESYGIYAYALAWVLSLASLSTLGFHVSLLRFIPAYRAKDEWSLARGVIRYSQRIATGAGLVTMMIGSGAALMLNARVSQELLGTFLVGLAAVPIVALQLVSAAVVRGFGGVVVALVPERIIRDSLALGLLLIVLWSGLLRQSATAAMAAMLTSTTVTLIFVQVSQRRLQPKEIAGVHPSYAKKAWLQTMLPLTATQLADNLMSRCGIIVLGMVGDTKSAGIFAVSFSMALLTALPRLAVSTVFAPAVSDLFARDDRSGLQALVAKSAALSLAGTACAAIPLLVFTSPLLAWFGKDFVAGTDTVRILVLGQLFIAASGSQQHLLTMTGHEGVGAKLLTICAGLNFIGCLLTVVNYGMVGAAIAMTGSLIIWNIAMGVFLYRRLNLTPGLIAASGLMRTKVKTEAEAPL